MHFVHVDDAVVFRSTSRDRATCCLLAIIDAGAPADPGTVLLDAHLLVGPREVVLVGGWFREILDLACPVLAPAAAGGSAPRHARSSTARPSR